MSSIEVVAVDPDQLGECPVWSASEQVLYWEDIDGHAIHRLDPSTGGVDSRSLPGRPGSFALTTSTDWLLVAMEHELVWFNWASGSVTPWLQLEEAGVGIRMNDGRTDPAGRFIAGSMFEDTGAKKTVGSLHQIEADGTASVLRTDIGVSNGLGFDATRGLMYWADSPTSSVLCWDYDVTTGQRTNEREFFDYHTVPGKPDGACVDADGCYWSASVHGWAVIRVTPDGEVDQRIELPVHKPTMPAFGGANLDMLYVTSIATGSDSRDGVAPGSLMVIDLSTTSVRGLVDPPFAGVPPAGE